MKKIIILESDFDAELYSTWIEKTGFEIEILPSWANSEEEAEVLLKNNLPKLDSAKIIVFTGGSDVNPGYFGIALSEEEKIQYKTSWPNNYRDYIEHGYLKYALAKGVSIFGICRGMQFINFALGGSLYYDLSVQTEANKHTEALNRKSYYHDIEFEDSSWFFKELNVAKLQRVSSRHHQAVKDVSSKLQVSARASDGVIEILESKDSNEKMVLVQCHPEFMEYEKVNLEFSDTLIKFLKEF